MGGQADSTGLIGKQVLEAVEMRRLKRLDQIETLGLLIEYGILMIVVEQIVHFVEYSFADEELARRVDDFEVLVGRTVRFERYGKVAGLKEAKRYIREIYILEWTRVNI